MSEQSEPTGARNESPPSDRDTGGESDDAAWKTGPGKRPFKLSKLTTPIGAKWLFHIEYVASDVDQTTDEKNFVDWINRRISNLQAERFGNELHDLDIKCGGRQTVGSGHGIRCVA